MNDTTPTAKPVSATLASHLWLSAALMRTALASLGVLAGTVVGAGCVDEIDRITDCQDICGRYADCFDSTYDVGKCRNNCDDRASGSATFDQTVDTCENCLDDRSCASATFSCTTECATIVP